MNKVGEKTKNKKMENQKNIAKAIIAVMKSVKGMEKNSKVGTGASTYNGTKDQDVKEVFNEELAKNGLCIMPISIEPKVTIERWEELDSYSKAMKTKQSVFTEIKTKYLLLHESGESIELAGYGHGIDTQDKGAGKATTYALKNCLLYTFLTPVGKIDDTETTHSNDIPTPQPIGGIKPKPQFMEANFEKAFSSKADIDKIKTIYSITPEVEEAYKVYVTSKAL